VIALVCDAFPIREEQRDEARRAAEKLGVRDVRFLGFESGKLGAQTELVARLKSLVAEVATDVVYAPCSAAARSDSRCASRAIVSALSNGPTRDVLFFGVEALSGVHFDISAQTDHKRAALACLARTPGLEGLAIEGSEAFSRAKSGEFFARRNSAGESASRSGSATLDDAPNARTLPRTTAVVSTWNKRDDVRINLESLRAQTLPFAEIVVVDNASRDGTAEMIAAEFPEVRLIAMPHDRSTSASRRARPS
jgi:hypothetical protein